ncbi:hypothetical protein DPMN_051926 [Dreissena polymorpha]|uniref:Uncharacterized protein n=1 Tax=Dreissena polymorpha TaxID=45954 RepID=A0A9D4HPE9_DREPO|nr:hypothetical protein DPMN_051926 [Dreissena polymorpha]
MSFLFLVVKLSVRLGVGNPDRIHDEFVDFQLLSESALPPYVKGMALDPFWLCIASIKTPLQKARFPKLSSLAFAALSIPH